MRLTGYLIELADAWLAPLGSASPRRATPRAAARTSACITRGPSSSTTRLIEAGVVGDLRAPDRLRLGPAPITSRFTEVWDAADIIRRISCSGEESPARSSSHGEEIFAGGSPRAGSGGYGGRYSHSMVPGGLLVMSTTTRLIWRTSLVIRVEMRGQQRRRAAAPSRRSSRPRWSPGAARPGARRCGRRPARPTERTSASSTTGHCQMSRIQARPATAPPGRWRRPRAGSGAAPR